MTRSATGAARLPAATRRAATRKPAAPSPAVSACALWEVHRRGVPFSYAQYTLAQSLVCPLTPLGPIVSPRAVKTLRDAGIRNSHQLAAAYHEGKLAAIAGFGDSSINLVKQWVAKHGKHVRPDPSQVGRAGPSAPPPLPEASAPGPGKRRTYSLSPALVFKPERPNRKDSSEQDNETYQSSAARERAEAQASARPSARRAGRSGRPRARRAAGNSNGGEP